MCVCMCVRVWVACYASTSVGGAALCGVRSKRVSIESIYKQQFEYTMYTILKHIYIASPSQSDDSVLLAYNAPLLPSGV